jgi:putrescine aminotransferase
MTGAPIETRSEGPLVFDEHGEAMLDCGGYGVFILGHRHPRVVEAAKRQLDIHPVSTRMLLHPWLPASPAAPASSPRSTGSTARRWARSA